MNTNKDKRSATRRSQNICVLTADFLKSDQGVKCAPALPKLREIAVVVVTRQGDITLKTQRDIGESKKEQATQLAKDAHSVLEQAISASGHHLEEVVFSVVYCPEDGSLAISEASPFYRMRIRDNDGHNPESLVPVQKELASRLAA